jgi:hypothetical protein
MNLYGQIGIQSRLYLTPSYSFLLEERKERSRTQGKSNESSTTMSDDKLDRQSRDCSFCTDTDLHLIYLSLKFSYIKKIDQPKSDNQYNYSTVH